LATTATAATFPAAVREIEEVVPVNVSTWVLFDAFGSTEKTLHANTGGHTGVPQSAGDDAAGFFARRMK
jgi:hypothetical protein